MNVFINPVITGSDNADGGIRRVVEAQCKYLGEFGWTVVPDASQADLIVNHGTLLEERRGVPMIAQCHGLYWHGYEWPSWYGEANKRVIETMVRADEVTAPSHWVGNAVARGMLVSPHVIHHGIEPGAWQRADSYGYCLWNKARTDPVSDHRNLDQIASMMPNVPFLTTFGQESRNVKVIGSMPYEQMKKYVSHAGVYLALVRETFGIGTLEPLAAGVPVVGWKFGGQEEIIQNEHNGILVPYGNYEMLAEAIMHVLNNRDTYGQHAWESAQNPQWHWRSKVQQYARLFDWTVAKSKHPVKVSVVITCHNLGRFLEAAVTSVLNQSVNYWECIIVDDASSDETPQIARRFLNNPDGPGDPRIRYHRCPENLGLSGARNVGWRLAEGKYVCFLDADDMLDRAALERLTDALDKDSSIHIAYGGLDIMDEHGGSRRTNDWPPADFDWGAQLAHLNQLPYSALMRRSVLERSGGYRVRDWRAEDAAFWTRVTSLGFRAKRVCEQATLVYRLRSDSKGGKEREQYRDRDGDWTYWFPWRAGASNGEAGLALEGNYPINPALVPFGAQGKPPKPLVTWPVRHHQNPTVSIIIPVGPGHEKYLVDALDSVMAQTCPDWECIVVDDTSAPAVFSKLSGAGLGHPHVKVVGTNVSSYWTGEPMSMGAGYARNLGVQHSRAPFLLFLDADDMLHPWAIESMLAKYLEIDGGYIYGDCEIVENFDRLGSRAGDILEAPEYDREMFLASGYYDDAPGRHSVTMLIAREDFDAVHGFDTKMKFWEDWHLPLKLAVAGVRGGRVAKPLIIYRYGTGTRRRAASEQEGFLKEELRKQFEPYAKGEVKLCNCGGGGGGSLAKQAALQSLADMSMEIEIPTINDVTKIDLSVAKEVRLKYIGPMFGAVPYKGSVSGRKYYFGLEDGSQYRDVDPRDVPKLLQFGIFEVVEVFT